MIHRVILREVIHRRLAAHLLSRIRRDDQEEACLALWYPGDGVHRYTGILGEPILPNSGDRDLHGDVTVRSRYLNRVLDRALEAKAGLAVLHSHPAYGWQDLSSTDAATEREIVLPFVRETGLPLLGLTLSEDEIWSARFWHEIHPGEARLEVCTDVRRVGPRNSSADSPPTAYAPYRRRTVLRRTLDSWGPRAQSRLARTNICIVGAGSVGSMVIEALVRMGMEQLTVIDPDEVALHNLDRLVYADRSCVGLPKVDIVASRVKEIATAERCLVRPFRLSIRQERAYCLAADADLVICCTDNAEARDVLNHLAYSNCLPMIDGGVLIDSPQYHLRSAKWRVHLVGPDMRCMRCLGQYTSSDAADERQGLRRNGRYIDGEDSEGPEPGQNTFAFCNSVASEEVRVLLRYIVGEPWWHDASATSGQWSFEHRFVEAQTEPFEHPGRCFSSCEFAHERLGRGRLGRPKYPFVPEHSEPWLRRAKRWTRRLRQMMLRAVASVASF